MHSCCRPIIRRSILSQNQISLADIYKTFTESDLHLRQSFELVYDQCLKLSEENTALKKILAKQNESSTKKPEKKNA